VLGAASGILLLACQSSEIPPVSAPNPTVTDDDREVMRAVLDQLLRPRRDYMIQLGRGDLGKQPVRTAASFLVVDSTIAWCESDKPTPPPEIRDCIGSEVLEHLRRLPQMSGQVPASVFSTRNARSLPIGGTLGADVVFMPSATAKTYSDLSRFRRDYPPGSAVVEFSAPAYLGTSAVIFYRHFDESGGFVHLVRRDGVWSILTTSGWTE
jgi:hypothetical protein